MRQLKLITISEEIYDKILNSFPSQLQFEDNIYQYFYGSKDKNKIYFNNDYIVIKECKFNYIYKLIFNKNFINNPTEWKQIKLKLDKTINDAVCLPDGNQCYIYINKMLKKYYTEEQIENILNSHEEDEDENLKQFHFTYAAMEGVVHKFTNCFKYDITKAHAFEIISLFPLAKDGLIKILKEAENAKKQGNLGEYQRFKNYVNLYVGALCRHGHRKTYNYIVHKVTRKIFTSYGLSGGILLYANTDSYTVCKPKSIINTSREIGDFKLEYHGDIYIYQDNNYWLMEYGNELVGSCKKYVRDNIKLSEGQVVHYKINREYICTDLNNQKHYREEIKDICIEKVNVVEH